jgi:polyphosphate kinase 2 (PPK2 family)
MKSINPEDFKVVNKIELSKLPTNLDSDASDGKKEDKLENVIDKLSTGYDVCSQSIWSSDLFTGMDTSGKDSLIREVLKTLISEVLLCSFKTPTRKS